MPSGTGNISKERRVIFRVASLCFSVTKTVASYHQGKTPICNGRHDVLPTLKITNTSYLY